MSLREIREELLADADDSAGEVLQAAVELCRSRMRVEDADLGDALSLGSWRLRLVRIGGFRGAANGSSTPPLEWALPAASDVVIVHAPNGAGKSTVADALRVTLHGGTRFCPSFVTEDLRKQVPVHRDAERARVDVGLENDSGHRLDLRWDSHAGGESCTASWSIPGTTEPERLSVGGLWRETVSAHRPVISYAELDHELRDAGRLSGFFTQSLGLGEFWAQLHAITAAESARADEAAAEWERLRARAAVELDNVDLLLADQYPGTEPPESLSPPTDVAAVPAWFARFFPDMPSDGRLPEGSASAPRNQVEPELITRLSQVADDATLALRDYRRLCTSVADSSFAGGALDAVRHLLDMTSSGGHDAACPVCSSPSRGWREVAEESVRRSRAIDEEFKVVRHHFAELRAILADEVLPHARAAGEGDFVRALAPLRTSRRLDSDQDALWRAVSAVLDEPGLVDRLREFLRWLAESSDVSAYWHAERFRVCAPLLRFHLRDGVSALRRDSWRRALAQLESTYQRVRDERVRAMEHAVEPPMRAFFADAGFDRFGIELSGGLASAERAALRLALSGREVTTGSLSVGQFNALVLAMLFGTGAAGPFGFLVLDDPVHAFDDMRIAALCEQVREQSGQGRQVVVFTHDDRVVTRLREEHPAATTMRLERDERDELSITDVTHPWQALVGHATELLQRNTSGPLSESSVKLLSLGFCRQALDAALREVVLGWTRGDPQARRQFDKKHTTRESVRWVRQKAPAGNPQYALLESLENDGECLNDLNAAGHGNLAELSEVSVERAWSRLRRVARFCADLTGEPAPPGSTTEPAAAAGAGPG
ncbi:hypothetical protein [Saccharopolyspora sp. NPDC002578]